MEQMKTSTALLIALDALKLQQRMVSWKDSPASQEANRAIKVVTQILEQQGCEDHIQEPSKGGDLTTLMDIIIFS